MITLESSPEDVLPLIANYLDFIKKHNDQHQQQTRVTRFHAKRIPTIDILSYLNRILKYAPCNTECLLSMLIYLELATKNQCLLLMPHEETVDQIFKDTGIRTERHSIVIDSYNIHRLLVTSIMVSIKFLSDVFYTNLHFSRVGGISVKELNLLELDFLLMCDFKFMTEPEDLARCLSNLIKFRDSKENAADLDIFRILRCKVESADKENKDADDKEAPSPDTPQDVKTDACNRLQAVHIDEEPSLNKEMNSTSESGRDPNSGSQATETQQNSTKSD